MTASVPKVWRTFAFSLVVLGLFAPAAGAAPISAWELTNPSDFRNDSWSFGELFTVGASNIEVTALGAYDNNGDGFVSGRVPVGIYRESDDALLASTTVNSADPLIGHYRFASITPLVLVANTAYRVVGVNLDDQYNITTGTPNSVDPRITWNSYGYCAATVLTSCDSFTGTDRSWFANFQIDSAGSAVPEPMSLTLVGLGLLGAGVRRYRGRA
jgi:hypothetical protein